MRTLVGELRTMFAQQDDEYLDDYFSEHPNMSVSWLHDLGKRRYSFVSEALLTEAGRATELVSKHVCELRLLKSAFAEMRFYSSSSASGSSLKSLSYMKTISQLIKVCSMVCQLWSVRSVGRLIISLAFHDGLDFVSIHETLIDDLKSALAPLRGKQSLEKQVETIAETKASRLSKRRALQHVSNHCNLFTSFSLTSLLGFQAACAPVTSGESIGAGRHC